MRGKYRLRAEGLGFRVNIGSKDATDILSGVSASSIFHAALTPSHKAGTRKEQTCAP